MILVTMPHRWNQLPDDPKSTMALFVPVLVGFHVSAMESPNLPSPHLRGEADCQLKKLLSPGSMRCAVAWNNHNNFCFELFLIEPIQKTQSAKYDKAGEGKGDQRDQTSKQKFIG